ncbi:MAG: hypothetical protein AABW82_01125 [Nanoarchaeota archaeon]
MRDDDNSPSDLGKAFGVITGPSLRGHLVNVHFKPTVLAMVGVPTFDIQSAKWHGFDLNWVVKQGLNILERNDADLRREIDSQLEIVRRDGMYRDFGVREYRERIAKTFHYIDRMGLAEIDWGKVISHMPQGADIFYRKDQCDDRETDFYSRIGYLGPFSTLENMPELHNARL